MPMAVPARQSISQQRSSGAANTPPPPNEIYTLMAAAQMHSEGRFLAPTGDVSDKMNSVPEADQTPIRTR